MTDHYPRLCAYARNGFIKFRVGLSFSFYMCLPHAEVAPQALSALDTYLEAVGSQVNLYSVDYEGEGRPLDAVGWEWVRSEMRDPAGGIAELRDANTELRYRFTYEGRSLGQSPEGLKSGEVCKSSFWFPTEYLEEQGPARMREVALKLAEPLSFCSGRAGLSFNSDFWMGDNDDIRKICFRYPGIGISSEVGLISRLGTRIRGIDWLTFLGQPALGALGGVEGLRAQLHSPGTTVQELEGDRAVITLGEWPEAGDTERGDTLPAYRELARVLEPWLYFEEDYGDAAFPEKHQWERRFLD